MCTEQNDKYFKPRKYKGLSADQYLDYLLTKLDCTFAMFDTLDRQFSEKPEFTAVIDRERQGAVSQLIRLQYVLGWDKASKVTTPYHECGIDTPPDLDHVVPVNEMAQLVIKAEPSNRNAMFVRAWLAPVALISSESHSALRYKNGTSNLVSGNPFSRYTLNHIYVEACGAELPSDFTIKDHYRCIAGNPLIDGILRKHGILP